MAFFALPNLVITPMLQRIQTVFLLLVAIAMGLTFFLPFWTHEGTDPVIYHGLYALNFEQISGEEGELVKTYFPFTWIGILAVISILVAIFEITRYNNRLLQIKLGTLNSLFMAGSLILAAYFATDFIKQEGVSGHYGVTFFLPASALFFNLLANRYIRKDERLVRSVDRIR